METMNKANLVPVPMVFFLTFVAILSQVAPSAVRIKTYKNVEQIPTSDSTSCGGILTGNEGSISYKPNEYLNPNERCIWIIRGTNVSDYHIAFASLGFSPGVDHQLTITGFGVTESSNPANPAIHIVPDRLGLYNVNNKTVVVITLHTGLNMTVVPGFSLEYAASNNGLLQGHSLRSKDFLIGTANGHLAYPETGNYDNWEVTTFVFLPPNNTYSQSFRTDIEFVVNGMERGYDGLFIYSYNVTSVGDRKWSLFDRLRDVTSLSVRTDDILLAVFTTDFSQVGSGFEIFFSSCNTIAD